MKLVVDIDEEEYKAILHCAKNTPEYLTICEMMIADGKPLDKIRSEIEKQEKWLLQTGYTAYNVDIAFDAIKAAITESEEKE